MSVSVGSYQSVTVKVSAKTMQSIRMLMRALLLLRLALTVKQAIRQREKIVELVSEINSSIGPRLFLSFRQESCDVALILNGRSASSLVTQDILAQLDEPQRSDPNMLMLVQMLAEPQKPARPRRLPRRFIWDDWDLWFESHKRYVPEATVDSFKLNNFVHKVENGYYRKDDAENECLDAVRGANLTPEDSKGYSQKSLKSTNRQFYAHIDFAAGELGLRTRVAELRTVLNEAVGKISVLGETESVEYQILAAKREPVYQEMQRLCVPLYVCLRMAGYSHRDLWG